MDVEKIPMPKVERFGLKHKARKQYREREKDDAPDSVPSRRLDQRVDYNDAPKAPGEK